jgi:hypothetical protein
MEYGEVENENYIEDYNNEYVNFKPNTSSTGCFNAKNQIGNFKNSQYEFDIQLKSKIVNKQEITVSTIKRNKSFTSNGLSFRDGSILMDKTTPVNLARDIVKKLNQNSFYDPKNKKCVSNTNLKSKKLNLNQQNALIDYVDESEKQVEQNKIVSSNAHLEENLFIKIFNQESFRGVKEKEMKVFDSDEENTKRQFQRSKRNLLEGINADNNYEEDNTVNNKTLNTGLSNNEKLRFYDNKYKSKIQKEPKNNVKEEYKNKSKINNKEEKLEVENKTKLMILATFACYQEGNAIFVSCEDVIFSFPIPLVGMKLKPGLKYSFAFNQKKLKKDKEENIKRVVSTYVHK